MKRHLQTAFSTHQYMRSEDFEVYYYHSSDSSKTELHEHDFYEFYFFLEGDCSIRVEDEVMPLKYGDMVIFPPHVKHKSVIHSYKQPYRRFVFWISQEYCNELTQTYAEYAFLLQHVQVKKEYIFPNDLISFNTIQAKMIQLIEEQRADRFGKEARLYIYINDLLLHLNRMIYERRHKKSNKETGRLHQNILSYIEQHLEDDLSLEKLAGKFFVSKYHISHVFKDNFGISIHQYVTKKRLAAIQEAMLGNMNITEAYLMFGFSDYSSFYRAFKKEYNISPREFVKAHTLVESKIEEAKI